MKLATVEKIHSFRPHTNADTLECAKIKAWPVVVRKGEFKDGELVVFITIDSIVPNDDNFKFLEKQKFRVWNAKFRGEPSSGLVQPLKLINKYINGVDKNETISWREGDDVTEILGITKHERPIDISINGKQAGSFPTHLISITDEDNALNYPEAFDELQDGQELYITLKNDGSSVTIINDNNDFKACTRRFEMQRGEGFSWRIVDKYDLETKLKALGKNLAIQGEAIGPKLNGNRLQLKDIEFRLFRAKNLDTNNLYNYNELKDLAKILNVPIVEELMVIKYDKNIHTIDWFQNVANNVKWPTNGNAAEGIVIAPVIPFYSYVLNKSWSVKLININYKQD